MDEWGLIEICESSGKGGGGYQNQTRANKGGRGPKFGYFVIT